MMAGLNEGIMRRSLSRTEHGGVGFLAFEIRLHIQQLFESSQCPVAYQYICCAQSITTPVGIYFRRLHENGRDCQNTALVGEYSAE